jgi:hypothetical protein
MAVILTGRFEEYWLRITMVPVIGIQIGKMILGII